MSNGKNVVIDLDDLDLLDEAQILSDIEKDSEKEGISFRPDTLMFGRDIYGRTLPTGSSDNPFKREGFND